MEKLEVANKELETARSLVATNYEKAKKFDDLNCELETIKTANLDLTSKEKMLTEKLEETTAIHKGKHLTQTFPMVPHAEFGPHDHREDARHFNIFLKNCA